MRRTMTSRAEEELAHGRALVRNLLEKRRSEKQDGYRSLSKDGIWNFVSTTLGPVTPEELDALFAFAGIQPDPIEPLGTCSTCWNSSVVGARRSERGYRSPCVSCLRPKHDLWEPIPKDAVNCPDCGGSGRSHGSYGTPCCRTCDSRGLFRRSEV